MHRRRKGGARGARAPPTFTRGVLSTPILDQLLRHRDHVIITSQRVFLGAFSILLFLGYFRVAKNDTFVSIRGLSPQTPASRIYFCCNYKHLSTPNFQTLPPPMSCMHTHTHSCELSMNATNMRHMVMTTTTTPLYRHSLYRYRQYTPHSMHIY